MFRNESAHCLIFVIYGYLPSKLIILIKQLIEILISLIKSSRRSYFQYTYHIEYEHMLKQALVFINQT